MSAVRAEIPSSEILLSSLALVRDDVERHVAKLDRYRALQAIEKTIADFPTLEDLTGALSDLRDNIRIQLAETREIRALRAVEKIMPELTEVLAFLKERSGNPPIARTATGQDDAPDDVVRNDITQDDAIHNDSAQNDVAQNDVIFVASVADIGEAIEPTQAAPLPQSQTPEQMVGAGPLDPGEAPAPANDAGNNSGTAEEAGSSPPPTISYGIAQFLNPDESAERPAVAQTRDEEEGLAQFRAPPAQEGRAA